MIKHPPLPLPSFYYPSFRAEIKVGDEIAVMAIGHLNSLGVFWVRKLPDLSNLQKIMLQNQVGIIWSLLTNLVIQKFEFGVP